MTTVGPNASGTGSNYNDGGMQGWVKPTNIQVDDSDAAVASYIDGPTGTSQCLYAKNFGFSIPEGATITSVGFSYTRKSGYGAIREKNIIMCDADGNPTGSDKADDSITWGIGYQTITKSGDSSYWGLTLTPALINDADFGLKITAKNTTPVNSDHAYVQFVSCTVEYVVGTQLAFQRSFRGMVNGQFRGMR